tara:strand:- start:16 stop:714 length:699 start_codon:yes stop_codon:yes gene_type:complete
MKTLINITLVASLAALTAQAAETTTHSLTDSYTQDNNVAGSGDGAANGVNNTASFEQYIGAAGGGAQERKAFFNIDLPTSDGVNALTSSANITDATLRIYYNGDNGTPTGDLSLFHATKSSINTVVDDMFITPYADTGLGITQGSTSGQYRVFDVTSFVQSTYDDANSIASFRFEVDGAITLGAGAAHVYKLWGGASTETPELVLTTVPEPSSFALLAGCFALTSIMVRRRR